MIPEWRTFSRKALAPLGAAIWLAAAPHAGAGSLSAARLAMELPRHFAGCFFWWGEEDGQEIRYAFDRVVPDGGRVIATGQGITTAGADVHQVRIRAVIDPSDLSVEIRESQPVRIAGRTDYITDGAFYGHLAGDLRRISATWITSDSGEKGDLGLSAADKAFLTPGGRAGLHCEGVPS